MKKTKFNVTGINCNSCVLLIQDRLESKQGVVKAKVSQESGRAVVIYDETKIDEDDIVSEIEAINNFKAEKIGEIENAIMAVDREDKPPVFSKFWAAAVVLPVIFLFFIFGQKNNQASVSEALDQVATGQVQQNQQAQTATAIKNGNPALDAYIVSRCPFGLQMQRVLADVIKNIPSLSENIKVRYMGSISGGRISSMHGDAEAQENLRQICIREEQPAKYWPYVSCQMKSGDTAGCEKSTGVNSGKLSACVSDSGKGLSYAKEDFDLNSKYNIKGSPTLILNGREVSEFDFGGRTSDALKSVVCGGFNSQPAVCSTKLTSASAAASFSETY